MWNARRGCGNRPTHIHILARCVPGRSYTVWLLFIWFWFCKSSVHPQQFQSLYLVTFPTDGRVCVLTDSPWRLPVNKILRTFILIFCNQILALRKVHAAIETSLAYEFIGYFKYIYLPACCMNTCVSFHDSKWSGDVIFTITIAYYIWITICFIYKITYTIISCQLCILPLILSPWLTFNILYNMLTKNSSS